MKQIIQAEIHQGFADLTLSLADHIKQTVDGAVMASGEDRLNKIEEVKRMIEGHTLDETKWREDFEKTMQPLITAMNTGGLLYRFVMACFKVFGMMGASIAAIYAGYEIVKKLWK